MNKYYIVHNPDYGYLENYLEYMRVLNLLGVVYFGDSAMWTFDINRAYRFKKMGKARRLARQFHGIVVTISKEMTSPGD